MIQKHKWPVLEFDDSREVMVKPNRNEGYRFPPRAVLFFHRQGVEEFVSGCRADALYAANHIGHPCEELGQFETITRPFTVYRVPVNGVDMLPCGGAVGRWCRGAVYGFSHCLRVHTHSGGRKLRRAGRPAGKRVPSCPRMPCAARAPVIAIFRPRAGCRQTRQPCARWNRRPHTLACLRAAAAPGRQTAFSARRPALWLTGSRRDAPW